MSHSVTVTRTVTSSHHEGTAFVLNTGHCRTLPGILKILQLICGIITTGIMGYYMGNFQNRDWYYFRPDLFFLLISTFAMITTACIVIATTMSIGTASILPRTFFEVVYHFVAFLLLAAASITLLVVVTERGGGRSRYNYRDRAYESKLAAASIGLINAFLYLLTFVFAIRSWRVM